MTDRSCGDYHAPLRQIHFLRQISHTDNSVQRGSDIVAHTRQKVTFRRICRIGCNSKQFLLIQLLLERILELDLMVNDSVRGIEYMSVRPYLTKCAFCINPYYIAVRLYYSVITATELKRIESVMIRFFTLSASSG